ncbi:MAG: TonB-dependent receptor, partial [Sediminibacterium sp.]|nr:TonB-dependent receptor [Sediminibacterium sp.]
TNSIGINYGFKIGTNGFLNISTFYLKQAETNRADNYTGNIYSPNQKIEDSTRLARKVYPIGNTFKANIYGLNRVEAGQFFYNFDKSIYENWHLYSFGGYSNRYITSWGFLRNAQPTDATSNPTNYPDGYLPILPGQTIDYSTVFGIRKITKLNWNIDLSTSIGENYLDFWAYNSSNPSMGNVSPKNFYLGRTLFNQITNELNISKHIHKYWFFNNLNIATGIQYRIDNFIMFHGDSTSYFAGPLTAINKDIGATGRPGISVSNEIDKKRNNTGLYIDLEGEINKKLLLTTAIRYENYSDFGNNVSFKFATIYQLNKQIGFRMSINKGFRAPSLQQIYNNQTTSTAQAGLIRLTENIRSNDPRLSQIGIQYPKPEIAYSYNIGITFKNKGNPALKASIDFYQINILDRIVISEILTVKDIPILANLFPTQKTITFFTNAINTQTNGVDFIGNYNINFDKNNALNINATYTYNQTKISNIIPTPSALLNGISPTTKVNLFDTISIGLIENAQPNNKWILQLNYTYKRVSVNLKSTYIGAVKTFEKYGGIYRSQ